MTRAEVLAFLRSHTLGVVATVSEHGAPEAAVVGIAVSDTLEIVFDTLRTTRKYRNIQRESRVSLVVGWGDEGTLQIDGVADEPAGTELERLRDVYFAADPSGRERLDWKGITHLRIRPTWMRFSDFRAAPPRIVELDAQALARPD